jgi:hypothetical protein
MEAEILARKAAKLHLLEAFLKRERKALRAEMLQLPEQDRGVFNREYQRRRQAIENSSSGEAAVTLSAIERTLANLVLPGDEVEAFLRFDKQAKSVTIEVQWKGAAFEVDVLKSLERDPANIGHPLVVWAIEKCLKAVSFTSPVFLIEPGDAEAVLNRIKSALRKGGKRLTQDHPLARWERLNPLPPEYCRAAWEACRAAGIKAGEPPTKAQERVLLKLLSHSFPEDHTHLLRFLNASTMPARGTYKAFENALQAHTYNAKMSRQDFKQYLHRVRKEMKEAGVRAPSEIPDDQMQELTEQAAAIVKRDVFGAGVIGAEESLTTSSLCWKELSKSNRLP